MSSYLPPSERIWWNVPVGKQEISLDWHCANLVSNHVFHDALLAHIRKTEPF